MTKSERYLAENTRSILRTLIEEECICAEWAKDALRENTDTIWDYLDGLLTWEDFLIELGLD